MHPRIQSTMVERTNPHKGMSNRLSTLAQRRDPGIAPSRAKAYVQRLAAVKAPTPAKNKIPRIKKSKANPPPADPVAVLKMSPIGWPFATLRRVATSGRTYEWCFSNCLIGR